jgi:hypothetical protein
LTASGRRRPGGISGRPRPGGTIDRGGVLMLGESCRVVSCRCAVALGQFDEHGNLRSTTGAIATVFSNVSIDRVNRWQIKRLFFEKFRARMCSLRGAKAVCYRCARSKRQAIALI